MTKREIKRQAKALILDAIPDLQRADSYEMPWEEERKQKSVYLGTVFSIMPSRKYYQPYACSNVDLCPRCKGKGCDYCGELGSREAHEDEMMQKYLEDFASEHDCWVESGEGDPCDLFLAKEIEEDEDNDAIS